MGCKGKAKGLKNHGLADFFSPAGYHPAGEGLTQEQYSCQFCRFRVVIALWHPI